MVSRRVKLSRSWRRIGRGMRVAIFTLLVLSLGLLFSAQRDDSSGTIQIGGGLGFYFIVNVVIIVIAVFAYLIGRNVVKLIFDRRRKLLGSRLRLRLVVAFVGLTLLPIALMFTFASGLLSKAMAGWFSAEIESVYEEALTVARFEYRRAEGNLEERAEELVRDIEQRPLLHSSKENLAGYLDTFRKNKGLFSIRLIDSDQVETVLTENAASAIADFQEPPLSATTLKKSLRSKLGPLSESVGDGAFIRSYAPIHYKSAPHVLVLADRVSPELAGALSAIKESYGDYKQLEYYKGPIRLGYRLTLLMITLLLLFGAIWIGFYVAREISGPIQQLAEGTEAVARGNYDVKIKGSRDDEMGFLVRSFNRMTADLKLSQAEVENRRRYIETIVSNLAVGVVGLSNDREVTSINDAALRILGLQDAQTVSGKSIGDLLQDTDLVQIVPLIERIESLDHHTGSETLEQEISVRSEGRELKVICTVGRIADREGRSLGTVLLFDDITDIAKSQHLAAWRDVARRIAHEIKNPLTPLQLSAQRLERLLVGSELEGSVKEASRTIVEHVGSIKRLANEFSNFARMPEVELAKTDLNRLITLTIDSIIERDSEVVIQLVADPKLPEIMADAEQLRRVFINLLDNALAAFENVEQSEKPRIVIRTNYDEARRTVQIEVCDNGPGLKEVDQIRIFEPYYTTKQKGTGLGLAIVTSIVSDHQGRIRAFNNEPTGAKFVIELPVSPRASTQRRFAVA